MPEFYLTTAIPYVNSDPHIGFGLEVVIADAIARYRRAQGDDVRFLTGTDDNSLKSVQAAEREGVPVAETVARYAERFEQLRSTLDLSFNDFIRTSSDPRHRPGAERLWTACAASGDVYKGHYRGLYCVGCESFFDDVEAGGICPEHGTQLEQVDEENWFFRLSRYGAELEELIEAGRLRIVPDSRRNEMLALIRSGLRDFSISRSTERAHGWGIPVPGDPSQVLYVWFDALGNYISSLDYATDGDPYEKFWVGSARRVHVIGKDIVRQHAVYWPAMLLSAGLPLPTDLLVHGLVTADGRKMSKSRGSVVDPFALVGEFGVDAVRYFLLRHIRTTEDGDFTRQRFLAVRDAELADQLGNLVARLVAMVEKFADGRVPAGPLDRGRLADVVRTAPRAVSDAMGRFEIHAALREIWRVIEEANRYIVETAPWVLAREGDDRLPAVLGDLCAATRVAATELVPFLPQTSSEVLLRVGEPGDLVRTGPPLFPKS